MIKILNDMTGLKITKILVNALKSELPSSHDIQVLNPDELKSTKAQSWITDNDRSWDDILIILHQGNNNIFKEEEYDFIRNYMNTNYRRYTILPVGYNPNNNQPPDPIAGIKSSSIDPASNYGLKLVIRRVKALLGVKLRNRDLKLFISYRNSDGNLLAKQIETFLNMHGYETWLDEAEDDFDGEKNIRGGEEVQEVIEKKLKEASLILLLDTPDAARSRWIQLEIDMAIGAMIPVLPICFKPKGERKKGPRFLTLGTIRRYLDLDFQQKLSNGHLEKILKEIEFYLADIFQSKCKVPYEAESVFKNHGYTWEEIDKQYYLYHSEKMSGRVTTKISSHCSFFDEVYVEALNTLVNVHKERGIQCNHRLFIYDGDVLSNTEINAIDRKDSSYKNFIIVHHQELLHLINNNFMRL